MTHTPGDPITIASYNNIIASVNVIFGTGTGNSGYGGNSTNVSLINLPAVILSTAIDNQDWLDLRNAQADIATHQGIALSAALPPIVSLENADLAKAFEDQTGPNNPDGEIDSVANLAQIVTNKNLSGGESFSIATKLTSARGTAWSIFLRHEFTVNFGTENAARHYFNTGGNLRVSASRTGGSATPQNAAWSALVSANSPYVFSQADYFALTGAFVIKRTVISGAPYASNNWTIRARRENFVGTLGGNGSLIRFQSDFIDGHTNVFADQVNGTFTSTIEERRSVGVFVRPTPAFATTIALTSGS